MAGRIPQEFINDLLDRVDVSEVIGARLELKRAGKEFKGLCPFRREDALLSRSPGKRVLPLLWLWRARYGPYLPS